jgi:SAM-dependent methyltransferase
MAVFGQAAPSPGVVGVPASPGGMGVFVNTPRKPPAEDKPANKKPSAAAAALAADQQLRREAAAERERETSKGPSPTDGPGNIDFSLGPVSAASTRIASNKQANTAQSSAPVEAPPSWSATLTRSEGYWGDSCWYEANLDRRLPLVPEMLDSMLTSCPPLTQGHTVCDLLAGTGRVTRLLLPVYPRASYTLVDNSQDRLDIAAAHLEDACSHGAGRLCDMANQVQLVQATVDISEKGKLPLPLDKRAKDGYDVIFGALATRVLVQPASHYALPGQKKQLPVRERYSALFRQCWNSLRRGGHFIIGDHIGILSLFDHLKLLEAAGFVEVDCAWRKNDFFVVGARKPLTKVEE